MHRELQVLHAAGQVEGGGAAKPSDREEVVGGGRAELKAACKSGKWQNVLSITVQTFKGQPQRNTMGTTMKNNQVRQP